MNKSSNAVIIAVDGLSFMATLLGVKLQETDPYLKPALVSMGLSVPDHDIEQFEWPGDAGETDVVVGKLRLLVRSSFERAKTENKKFIVVAHSWGTFLTYMALLYESSGDNPVIVDLYVTLGSPLGTGNAHKGKLYSYEKKVVDYVDEWLKKFDLNTTCPGCKPNATKAVNYWATGDIFSGPLRAFLPQAEEINEDSKHNPDNWFYRNVGSTAYWHYYDSLQTGNNLVDNKVIRSSVKDLIENTLDT